MTDIEQQTKEIAKGFERLSLEIGKGFKSLIDRLDSGMKRTLGLESPSTNMEESYAKTIMCDGFGNRIDEKSDSPWVLFDINDPKTYPPDREEVLIKLSKILGITFPDDSNLTNEIGYFREDTREWVVYNGDLHIRNNSVTRWMHIPQ